MFSPGIAVALQTLGINVTTLAASGAALGVGSGFGLQDLVKNFVAGLVIQIERPFQVGDRIEMDRISAEATEIRARTSVPRTNDDVHLIASNSKLTSRPSPNPELRPPALPVPRAGRSLSGCDPRVVEWVLVEAAVACDGVLPDPRPDARFRGFGASSLDFEVLCWTEKMLHRPGKLVSDLKFEVCKSLERHGVELASPHTVVRLVGLEPRSRAAPARNLQPRTPEADHEQG